MSIFPGGKDTAMFITFEGVEGSGKSLQVQNAYQYLTGKGVACLLTREPGGTEFGRALREVLLKSHGARREPVGELLLYLADRYQDLKELIEPAVRKGIVVISDRYHDATRAYQGAARGVPADVIDSLARILKIPEPDRTILLDLEPAVALTRARHRNVVTASDEGRFEAEDISFHARVRESYLALARRFPNRIEVISGEGSPAEVFGRISPMLDVWVPRGRSPE
jgi:dTMP kinase